MKESDELNDVMNKLKNSERHIEKQSSNYEPCEIDCSDLNDPEIFKKNTSILTEWYKKVNDDYLKSLFQSLPKEQREKMIKALSEEEKQLDDVTISRPTIEDSYDIKNGYGIHKDTVINEIFSQNNLPPNTIIDINMPSGEYITKLGVHDLNVTMIDINNKSIKPKNVKVKLWVINKILNEK